MSEPNSDEKLILKKLILAMYKFNEFSASINDLRNELAQIHSSIKEGVRVVLKDSTSSSLSTLKEVSFEVRSIYLEQALSFYPETASLNLNDGDRKILCALMRGECTRNQLSTDAKMKWRNVRASVEKLIKLKLVEPVIYEGGRDRYHFTPEFAHKLERALHIILLLE